MLGRLVKDCGLVGKVLTYYYIRLYYILIINNGRRRRSVVCSIEKIIIL